MKKNWLPFARALAALAVGLAVGWRLPRGPVVGPAPVERTSASTASVLLDYDDGRVTTYADMPVTAGDSVWQLMAELTRSNHLVIDAKDFGGELGRLVTGIGGVANDAARNRFWHYWVNQRFADVGVSAYRLQPGDQVMWKYTGDQFRAETK